MDFFKRAANFLREQYSQKAAGLNDMDLRAAIEYGVRRAWVYKFETEADIIRFIDLQWRIDKNFDRNLPWAKDILNNTCLNPKQKIEELRTQHIAHMGGLLGAPQ